jgi:crotonobetainyl-CoA:carnitine CoA-transferase CaiB-like acyl-CoA transferase
MLEFSQIIAGPVAGVYLSDLGVDVVKVEPPRGDDRRNTMAMVPNEGKYFQSLNRGKRGLVVDLQRPQGRSLIHRIIPTFDVVTINYRPGVAKRLEIDYETLSAIRPDLIYVNITGFGERGPESQRAGSDIVAQAYSGLMATEGNTEEDGAPKFIQSAPYADRASALVVAMGVSSALFHRERTGEGQLLDVSLLQTALDLLSRHVMQEPVHDATLRDPMIARIHELQHEGEPYSETVAARQEHLSRYTTQRLYYRGYHTKEGAVVLGSLTRTNREGVRRVLDIEDPTDDADFDANDPGWPEEFVTWQERVQERMYEETANEWVRRFDEAGVPASVVHLAEEMGDDPQVEAMGMMSDLVHPVTGPQRVVGPVLQMSKSPTSARRHAPVFGADTSEVLLEAGIGEDEIGALLADGTILGPT